MINKNWFKYYVSGKSTKEIELNRILDKISDKTILTLEENKFLVIYDTILDTDYSHLSVDMVLDKCEFYLKNKKKIYCDICDNDGKINQIIKNIDRATSKLILKRGEYILTDNFLYDITHHIKRDDYSLTTQDEYFEKITTNK